MTPPPDVSVIVAVYNARPYIGRCVGSVIEQSIGAERLELIVVDDGSTDGTAEELDRLAASTPFMRVVHQLNSGGPAKPRNVGLDHAHGRYVFILDADDHLNPEALARMVSMADECGSDVLLGRMEAGGGRAVPRAMFRYDQPNADLYTSHVYWTLNPMKLYRREFLERLGLRFRLDLPYGEDLPFVATAYLNASVISVLADYPCVHWVNRDDRSNITLSDFRLESNMTLARVMFALAGESVEPGPKRDHLFKRHFAYEIDRLLTCLMLEEDSEARAAAMHEIAQWTASYYNDTIDRAMQPHTKVCLNLIARGMGDELVEVARFHHERTAAAVIIEDDRVFARYPYFRDMGKGVPDAAYEVTHVLRPSCHLTSLELSGSVLSLSGQASIAWLGQVEVTPVLRQRESGEEIVCEPAEQHDGTFEARVDFSDGGALSGVGLGHWDVWLQLEAQGYARELRPGPARDEGVPNDSRRCVVVHDQHHAVLYDAYFTPFNNITMRVSDATHHMASVLTTSCVSWGKGMPTTLAIEGRVHAGGIPAGAVTVALTCGDAMHKTPANLRSDGSFEALVPLARAADGRPLPDGRWSVSLRLDVADLHGCTPVRWSGELAAKRWRRGMRIARARAWSTEKGSLRLTISAFDVLGSLKRRLMR